MRVSLFGGGTDYPAFYLRKQGVVVGFAIDRYIHIAALPLSQFGPYQYSLGYSTIEQVEGVGDVKHSVFREVLKRKFDDERWQFTVMSDVPAGTGLGSSSSFTVGLLNLVEYLNGKQLTRYDLAREAIRFERDILKENVGSQDQLHAAFGGVNCFRFKDRGFLVEPIALDESVRAELECSMVLISTQIHRQAAQIAKTQVENTSTGAYDSQLSEIAELAENGLEVLRNAQPETVVGALGEIVEEYWAIKKRLGDKISNPKIEALYTDLKKLGASGVKLCGAGGGGFMLALGSPDVIHEIEDHYGHLSLPVRFDAVGSTIVT